MMKPPHMTGADGKTGLLHATLMLLLLCVIWGGTFPATKAALAVSNPVHFLALRFSLAVLLFLPLFIVRRRARFGSALRGVNLQSIRASAGVGLLLLIGFGLQVVGMRYTTASRSGFFTGLLVVITPIVAAILRTSRLPGLAWLGIPFAALGIYLLAAPETGGLNVGDWLTIGCAFVFALQMVTLEAVARRVKDLWLLTCVQLIVIMIGALLWWWVEGEPFRMNATGWLAVGYTALLGGVAAVWMQTRYQPLVPAGHAAMVFTLEPVFAGLFAWMLLGEIWTLKGMIGAGMILVAMGVSSLAVARSR